MMTQTDSIDSILEWQSGLISREVVTDLQFSLKDLVVLPHQAAYIVDCRNGNVVDATPGFSRIFGYDEFLLRDVVQLYESVVKNDLTTTLQNTRSVIEWMFGNKDLPVFENSAEFRYRIKQKNGKYRKILRQTAVCNKVQGVATHTIGLLTDITHLDNTRDVNVWVHGPGAEYFDGDIPEMQTIREILSPRECEILKLLARGMTSREIAGTLSVSRHTIDTHRRNMIHKVEAKNSTELINIGRDLGLI